MKIKGFDWDAGNIAKCQKHGLSVQEIEVFFIGDFSLHLNLKHPLVEVRYTAVGRHPFKLRLMLVVFVLRNDLVRPISARYLNKKEAFKYEKKEKN